MITVRVYDNFTVAVAKVLSSGRDKAAHAIATQAAKDTEPYVPMRTGSLRQRTQVKGNMIIYPGPYARYLYYGKVMVDEYGNGPRHYVDRHGNEVIKFPYGSRLHATDRNLNIVQGQAHWFEASKAQNLDKWLRVAEKAVTGNG